VPSQRTRSPNATDAKQDSGKRKQNSPPKYSDFIACRVLGDKHKAQIAIQDCWRTASRNPPRFEYEGAFRSWLARVRNLENHAGQARQAADDSTYRTWRLYMAGSAHFFETGRLNVYQSLLAKSTDGNSGLPLTREDWYR